jgi:hypothetical protein
MPISNGLYKAHFRTPLGEGFGVVHLLDGKLRGGDSSIYYVGSYIQDGDQFSANIATDTHSVTPGIRPVFGKDQVNITVSGTVSGETVQMTGSAAEVPGVSFQSTLIRLCD